MKWLRPALAVVLLACACPALADDRLVQLSFTPTRRAQIAVWIESSDGARFRTLLLTQAVARYGIGNRPGALQMNSGYHWPYGRREGVLPVWARRRVEVGGGQPFSRVIFRDRASEGRASVWPTGKFPQFHDTRDDYFCLSFQTQGSSQEGLDAVSCASVYNSDKGRYITPGDVQDGYGEPGQDASGAGVMFPLDLRSFYPPRRDIEPCTGSSCAEHPDVYSFRDDARAVLPEIDEVTSATLAEQEKTVMFTVPSDWPDGDYTVWVEVNTEGDHNAYFSQARFPTPTLPADKWDVWAITYGYPYRGQPSTVYTVPIRLGPTGTYGTNVATGVGALTGREAQAMTAMSEMADRMTNDPVASPGSGVDRLRATSGERVHVDVRGREYCMNNTAPGEIADVVVGPYHNRHDAHMFANLSFVVPADDQGVSRYEVRLAREPITDEASFLRGTPALRAQLEPVALTISTSGRAGSEVEVDFGGLLPVTRYWIGIRAVDGCNVQGPIAVAEYLTPEIEFTTVSPCFVATAAYGSPLAGEIGALRRFRDRHLMTNAPGRALVSAYYAVGPSLADAIREDDSMRATVRAALVPVVQAARWLDGDAR